VNLGRRADERVVADEILRSADDRIMLKMLREETTMLVLMVRVEREKARAEWEQREKDSDNELI
jgi:hypothetical protein